MTMLSWKRKIQNMPANTVKTLEERRAFNDTAVALANNRVNLNDTIRLAAHDAFGDKLTGGFIIPRMSSSDLIDLYKRLDAAKLDFFRELPRKEQRGKTKEYDILKSKLDDMVKLCDEILKNKDLQSILQHPKEVERIARATAGSSEVSLYGRLRSVLRLAKGALSVGAVATIVYFVYLWASGSDLPWFLVKYSGILKPFLGKAREVVSGFTEKAAAKAWDAWDNAWDATSSYAGKASSYAGKAWESTSAFRDAAKSATSDAYANLQNTSLKDLARSGLTYFGLGVSGGEGVNNHEHILFGVRKSRLLEHQVKSRNILLGIVMDLPSRPKAGRIYQAIELFPVLPSVAKKHAQDQRLLERALQTSNEETNLEKIKRRMAGTPRKTRKTPKKKATPKKTTPAKKKKKAMPRKTTPRKTTPRKTTPRKTTPRKTRKAKKTTSLRNMDKASRLKEIKRRMKK